MPKAKQQVYRKPKTDPGIPNLTAAKKKLAHQIEMHKQTLQGRPSKNLQPKPEPKKQKRPVKADLSTFAKVAMQKQQVYQAKQLQAASQPKAPTHEKTSSKCFFLLKFLRLRKLSFPSIYY